MNLNETNSAEEEEQMLNDECDKLFYFLENCYAQWQIEHFNKLIKQTKFYNELP